ncbi:MAG: hypothetical protein Q8P33_02565 [bacterium]|nr:hypothetical protein [bacterium]
MTWIRTLWSDRLVRAGLLVGLLAILTNVAWLLWGLSIGSSAQVLHYNIYFGADLYGPGYALWVNPALSLLVLLLNAIVAALTLERQTVAARLIIWTAALFSLIVLAGTLLLALSTPQ